MTLKTMSFVPIKWENCVIKKAEESRRNLEKKIPRQKKKGKRKKPQLLGEMLVTRVGWEICFWHLQSQNLVFLLQYKEG